MLMHEKPWVIPILEDHAEALLIRPITKTCLFKYTENFTNKNEIFQIKNSDIFSYFCSKHRLWVFVRTASYPQYMF